MADLRKFSQMALVICAHESHDRNGLLRYIICLGRDGAVLWKDGPISWGSYRKFSNEFNWLEAHVVWAQCPCHTNLA